MQNGLTWLTYKIGQLKIPPNNKTQHRCLIALVDCANDEKIYDENGVERIGRIYPRLYRHRTSGELRLVVKVAYETGTTLTEYYRTTLLDVNSQSLFDFVQIDGNDY